MRPLARAYEKIPIVDTARRCGLVLDPSTLRRREVEASCPFCGDHGKGKYHLSLNVDTDQYRCNLCGASGNSVSLYARLHGLTNIEAYEDVLRRELDGLDDDFATLKLLSQELSFRAQTIRSQRAA